MIDGTFQHQDSIGGGGLITNGSTQWMTAGSGILHIERPPEQLIATRRPVPRDPALGQPAVGRQVDRPALPGHRGGQRPAAHLPRRRRARPGHRRRRRRPPRPRLDAHADLAGARHRRARRRAGPALAAPSSTRSSTCSPAAATVGPDARPLHTGQLAVHGPGDALVAAGRHRRRSPATPPSTSSSSAASPIGEPVVRPRALRHEHPGRDRPGLRGLRGRQARHRPGRPHRQRLSLRTAAGHDRSGDPGSEATNSATWSAADIGDLTGRVALVTGANSGIGYETAARPGRPRRARDHGLPQPGEGAPGPRQARERARPVARSSCSTSTWPTWSRCAAAADASWTSTRASTSWSTTRASWARPTARPPTASSCRWPPTTWATSP